MRHTSDAARSLLSICLLAVLTAALVLGLASLWPKSAKTAPRRETPVIGSRGEVGPKRAEVAQEKEPDWRSLSLSSVSYGCEVELAAQLEQIASVNPEAIAVRLAELSYAERCRAVAAVLLSAACNPDMAAHLAGGFCAADPSQAKEHGYALLEALAKTGEFEAAARFIELHANGSEASETPLKWQVSLYSRWARSRPETAVAHALAGLDDARRDEALRAIADAWSETDPRGAIDYLAGLQPTSARSVALERAIARWAETDPVHATEWLARRRREAGL